jgi:hypothetical protein
MRYLAHLALIALAVAAGVALAIWGALLYLSWSANH